MKSSIRFTPSETSNQNPPFISHSQIPSQVTDWNDLSKCYLEELGINIKQFKALFNNLPQGVVATKIIYNKKNKPIDFVTIASNKAYDDIHSAETKQIICNTNEFNVRTKHDHKANWLEVYRRVASSNKPERFETYLKTENQWYQVYNYRPKKTFLVSFFTDITEQKKKAERELKERKNSKQQIRFTEKRYRRLYKTTRDGIMARNPKGKMIDCNVAYAKMLGYSKKELKNMTIRQLLPEKWFAQRERIVKKVLKTKHSIVFEREYKRKDGTIFPASVRTWPLTDEKGKTVGIWSIVRDITEQKERQKYLQEHADYLKSVIEERTKQLKESERLAAIGQTAGMVGHDLRNPLQTVIGELYLAKNEVNSLADCEIKNSLQESIQTIEEQTIYMDKIVSDLQAFVQPVKIEKGKINLKELVATVLSSVAKPDNIFVKEQIDEPFPQINADLQLLKRVLINLVTNSIQAMPNGGNLTIAIEENPKGKVSISVQDTGVGISDLIKNQIFTPLFTTKPHGQGFGLAVCKRIIEAHGGTITFKSQEGKGSIFTTQFPAISPR